MQAELCADKGKFFFCRCQSCFANRLFWMQSACFLMKGCENVKETLSRLFVTGRTEGSTDREEKGSNRLTSSATRVQEEPTSTFNQVQQRRDIETIQKL